MGKFGENDFFFVSMLKSAGKRVKNGLNFENEKNRFAKFENVFSSRILEFFENGFFSRRFGI